MKKYFWYIACGGCVICAYYTFPDFIRDTLSGVGFLVLGLRCLVKAEKHGSTD